MTRRTLVIGDPVFVGGATGVLDDGALVIMDDTVEEVGPRAVLETHGPFDEVIGGPDVAVLPGFVNAHYHTECWTAPGLIDEIFELGNLYVGSSMIETDLEVIELLATYGLVQALKGGQTTTIDAFYGRPSVPLLGAEAVMTAYDRVGMRTALALSLRDQNRYGHRSDDEMLAALPPEIAAEVRASPLGYAWPIDEMVAIFHELHDRWDGRDGRFRVILAPDWTPACSDELYVRARRLADDYDVPLTSHVLETRAELMWNLDVYGKPGVRRLADLGVLGPDVSFSHFVWATDEDIAIAADHGVTAVNCIGSNMRTSVGLCRVRDILEAGGRVAFGTDGVSVGDREDFLSEIRVATILQRQPDRFDEHRIDSEIVLGSATAAGAAVSGFGSKLGTLEPGCLADLVCVDTSRIMFPRTRYPRERILDVLVDRADAGDISRVMVAGKVVVADGRVLTIDEDQLVERITDIEDRLYRPTSEAVRRSELAAMFKPQVVEMCEDWYSRPITRPASIFNTRSAPGPASST
ncbi:MAG: amidohydrolase family protein [Acidimicrobiales bacterium]